MQKNKPLKTVIITVRLFFPRLKPWATTNFTQSQEMRKEGKKR